MSSFIATTFEFSPLPVSHVGAGNGQTNNGQTSSTRPSIRTDNGSPVAKPTLSFVIPVKDEAESIAELYSRIEREAKGRYPFEVIFVDDGSRDASWATIVQLALGTGGNVRGIRFRRNAGKAAALISGFREAQGDVIFTLDGDLQDDPKEIPHFLQKLGEGYDLVSGWKRVRHDPWHKVLPSRVFNRLISRLGGVALHDHNCGFKCYRAEVAKSLAIYGELHRMIPSLAAMKGYRSTEIEVLHHPRLHGRSKYGVRRFLHGFFDMLTIYFLRHFSQRPAHFSGAVGMVMLALGLVFLAGGLSAGVGSAGGIAAMGIGAAMLAATPILWTLGVMAELLNPGGQRRQWEPPICEEIRSRNR